MAARAALVLRVGHLERARGLDLHDGDPRRRQGVEARVRILVDDRLVADVVAEAEVVARFGRVAGQRLRERPLEEGDRLRDRLDPAARLRLEREPDGRARDLAQAAEPLGAGRQGARAASPVRRRLRIPRAPGQGRGGEREGARTCARCRAQQGRARSRSDSCRRGAPDPTRPARRPPPSRGGRGSRRGRRRWP